MAKRNSRQPKPTKQQKKKPTASAAPSPKTEQPRTNVGSQQAGHVISFDEVMAELETDEADALVDALPPRRRAFVHYYTSVHLFGNATQAAIQAGYSERSARSIGSELLTFPDVAAAINARMKLIQMGAEEVIARYTMIARADITPYLEVHQETGKFFLKLDELKEAGLGFLIKEVWESAEGLRVKLHDSMVALEKLGRFHNLFVEQIKHSGMVVTVTADNMAAARQAVTDWEKERFGEDTDDASNG